MRRGPLGPHRGRGALMLPAQGPRAHRELLVPPGTQEPRRDAGDAIRASGGGTGAQQGVNARREAEDIT